MIFSRRNFIKIGGTAAAGSIIVPPFLQACTMDQTSMDVKMYLNHFEVDLETLQNVISTALSKGGDYADLFFEHKLSNSVSLEDGKVNKAFSNVDFGVGIRVLKADQTGFAYSENLQKESMIGAAKMAANIANSQKTHIPVDMTEFKPANFYPVVKSFEDISIKSKIPFVQKLNEKVFALDDKVEKVRVFMNDETSYVLFFNSEGKLTYDFRPMVTFGVNCVMEKNGQKENAYVARSYRKGFELMSDDLVDTLAKEVVKKVNTLFEAVKPKSGEMPVVMGAGGSGILLHEAIGHTFEADFNRKGTSIFSDKMGKKVAESFVNIIDDGTIENNRGSINIDDEGNEGQKTYLVKDGILNSYIHDRISANHYKVAPTGNGRRQSFRHPPLPRMRATYMEEGTASLDDLLADVKYGVFAESFTNGQVKIGAGDFTFFVKLGYLIENGKLTQPIKDINIIGNGPQALADIENVASDYAIDNSTWTCGKDGQSVPVTCGLPSALVKKLTVGGTN